MRELNTVNILGVEYPINKVPTSDALRDSGNIAECENFAKTITIALEDCYGTPLANRIYDELITHEIAHAFLFQTGNEDINDERHANLLSMFSMFMRDLLKEEK